MKIMTGRGESNPPIPICPPSPPSPELEVKNPHYLHLSPLLSITHPYPALHTSLACTDTPPPLHPTPKPYPRPHHSLLLPSTTLISRIYRAPVHSSQPVTHALWVDPGRIQFVRYYVLIPVVCAPLCTPRHSPHHHHTHTHTHLCIATIPRIIITEARRSEPLLGSPASGFLVVNLCYICRLGEPRDAAHRCSS